MEVDFAGQTFAMTDPPTDDFQFIAVFVAVLPFTDEMTVKVLRTNDTWYYGMTYHEDKLYYSAVRLNFQ